MGKILLVITTFNQSEYTKLCFESLKKLDDNFDVLVVDDCSSDNTVELCKEYGYEVITKDEGKGLTDSWNLGYNRFKEKLHFKYDGYDYLIIANNDILIPKGALSELVSVFEKWPYTLVVPTSTTKGVGHNSQFQSVELFYNGVGNICNQPDNYQNTQDTMLKIKNGVRESNNLYQLDPVRVKMFNGFFFMMNKNISNYEYENGVLFNPKYKITKNEDEFNWSKLIPNDDFPAVCKTSFIYHYKGVSAFGDLRDNDKWKTTRFQNENN
jgi:glycosyltransferase involved in cell wall biosynthesis